MTDLNAAAVIETGAISSNYTSDMKSGISLWSVNPSIHWLLGGEEECDLMRELYI